MCFANARYDRFLHFSLLLSVVRMCKRKQEIGETEFFMQVFVFEKFES